MSDQDRIDELERLIRHHREQYYEGDPEISNRQFDALVDELRELNPDSVVLSEIGSEPGDSGWPKMTHSIPMGSLNKVNSAPELADDWFPSVRESVLSEILEPDGDHLYYSEKLDGISIALYYVDGQLRHALTRGDGHKGEDIIDNVVLMDGVQTELDRDLTGGVRGEIVLHESIWEEYLSDYSNPRNAAAGIARLESRDEAKTCRHLSVYVYEAHLKSKQFDSKFETFHFLEDLGFKTPNHGGPYQLDEISDLYGRYEAGFREEIPYDIDGLVIELNDRDLHQEAGQYNNRPLGSVALKFASETALTTLEDVQWQVGESQRVTPVAIFDEVRLARANVTNASLYNVSYIENELEGLCIGDEILVERANDVIPRVLEVTDRSGDEEVTPPDSCPICESPLEFDGEHLVCTSTDCFAYKVGRLQSWIDVNDFLEWGDFLLEELVRSGLVEDIPDLYELDASDIASLEDKGGKRVGQKVASKVIDRLHAKESIPLDQFFGGLGIDLCRVKTFQKLIDHGYDSVSQIRSLDESDVRKVEGFGDKKARLLVEGLEENEQTIDRLLDHVDVETPGGSLEGLSFCITGRLSEPRSQYKKRIKEAGGRYKGSVTQDLDYLVTNNPDAGSNKLEKANRYGTDIISEDELLDMLD